MHQRLNQLPAPPAHAKLAKDDWLAAACVFLLVLLSTFPVVIPFFVASYAKLALRVSNGVAILMLLITCCALGRDTGRTGHPWAQRWFLSFAGVSDLSRALCPATATVTDARALSSFFCPELMDS